jgi:hypothetical protein
MPDDTEKTDASPLIQSISSVSRYLQEFQSSNEKIQHFDMCLCVDSGGVHRILPILRNGKFLNGEIEIDAIWFCKVETATRLIGQLFSQNAEIDQWRVDRFRLKQPTKDTTCLMIQKKPMPRH